MAVDRGLNTETDRAIEWTLYALTETHTTQGLSDRRQLPELAGPILLDEEAPGKQRAIAANFLGQTANTPPENLVGYFQSRPPAPDRLEAILANSTGLGASTKARLMETLADWTTPQSDCSSPSLSAPTEVIGKQGERLS